jgi:hypothetical protein
MKTKFLMLPVEACILICLSIPLASLGDVITFDDIVIPFPYYYYSPITNGYHGLNWSNFGPLTPRDATNNGYYYGMVSPPNVAFNGAGSPAEIDALGTNFNFLSVYLTGAWNSNLNIEVQGYRDTNLIYDETLVVSATNATLFTFNYLDIDRLYFNSYGGDNAGFGGSGEEFVMDNFEFEFIPEPSSFLLAALGCISLVALVRHRSRASGKPADGGFLRRKRM